MVNIYDDMRRMLANERSAQSMGTAPSILPASLATIAGPVIEITSDGTLKRKALWDVSRWDDGATWW